MHAKHKTYFLYKAASSELFLDLPCIDLSGLQLRHPHEVGRLQRRLYIGYERNRRCAELREHYRDHFVPEAERDEKHEDAIREAHARTAFYQDKLTEMAKALQRTTAKADTPRAVTPPAAKSRTAPRSKKPGLKKLTKAEVPRSEKDGGWDITEEELRDLRREAYGYAEEFYDRLVREISSAARKHVEGEPSNLIVNALIHCVTSLYGRKAEMTTDSHQDWFNNALERMRKATDDELRYAYFDFRFGLTPV